MEVRVRFAPSPSGFLHVGGARTALFNWLFARHNSGKFIIRIEDTDQSRSTEESIDIILSDLKWLGLDWDEGPFKQTDNFPRYKEIADKLLASDNAYPCFCSAEELDAARKLAQVNKLPPRYSGKCALLTSEERQNKIAKGYVPSIRLRTPFEGAIVVHDIVRGRVEFDSKDIDDFIIVRSDGIPTYNFAVVVDDHDMRISHIIRGEDHLSNTPKQIFIYRALEWEVPKFAHVSLILGHDRVPLSKRHAAVAVDKYRSDGYFPEAVVNFLALLGWSFDDKTTIFSLEELIEKFTLERVSKSGAIFDHQKLAWINGQYMRTLPLETVTAYAAAFFVKDGFIPESPSEEELENLSVLVDLCRERIVELQEMPQYLAPFFKDVEPHQSDLNKVIDPLKTPLMIEGAIAELESLPEITVEKMEERLKALANDLGIKMQNVYQPLRLLVLGNMDSPPLLKSFEILGKETVVRRLRAGLKNLRQVAR